MDIHEHDQHLQPYPNTHTHTQMEKRTNKKYIRKHK